MKTNLFLRTSALLSLFIILLIIACKDDDNGPVPIIFADAVSSISVADVGDAGNGTDLQVTFGPVNEEAKINAYRLIVVKTGNAGSFTLAKAEATPSDQYMQVNKTGGTITTTFNSDSRDTDGDLIANDIPYKVFVLSIADGLIATENALSSPSDEVKLTTAIVVEVSADPVTNLGVEDVADNGNGSDLKVSFMKAADEDKIAAYQLYVVKSNASTSFTLETAESNTNFVIIQKTGLDQSIILAEDALDTDGDGIKNDEPYVVFVMSLADGQNATINVLSDPSSEITLITIVQVNEVEVTYIANDGVMISNGEKTVMIDAVNSWGNLQGWIRPSSPQLLAIENGNPPYDDIDVIMITHAHGDHYSTSAVQNYLSDHPNTKLISTPQVLSAFSAFSSQIVDLSLTQFNKETVIVNDIEIDVLYIKHFNQFGNDFCTTTQNFGYVVHMEDKTFMHLGDVDLDESNLDQLDLLADNITVVMIPTFGDLISQAHKTALIDHVNPQNIIALHFLISQMPTSISQVNSLFPDAIKFTEPFEVVRF